MNFFNYFSPILFSGGHFLLSASPDSPFSHQLWGRQHQDLLHRASRGVHTGEDNNLAISVETCNSTTIYIPLNLNQHPYHSQN